MKNFKLFHFKFLGIFHFFIPSDGMANFFSNFISNFKIDFFQNFPFPSGGKTNFFQKSKTKIFNSNFKNDFFSNIFISKFPCAINEILFSAQGCQIY
jgi:hypothetical protein